MKGKIITGEELADVITKPPYAHTAGGWNMLIDHLRKHGYYIVDNDDEKLMKHLYNSIVSVHKGDHHYVVNNKKEIAKMLGGHKMGYPLENQLREYFGLSGNDFQVTFPKYRR